MSPNSLNKKDESYDKWEIRKVDGGKLQKVYWEYAQTVQACNFNKRWIYEILGCYNLI